MAIAKKCYLCDANLDKNAIGLNKKLLDRNPSRFLCINCLAAHLDASVEDLKVKLGEFKNQGCKLFE